MRDLARICAYCGVALFTRAWIEIQRHGII